jgi:hypothetical protein
VTGLQRIRIKHVAYPDCNNPGAIVNRSHVCREIESGADDVICSAVAGDSDHGQMLPALFPMLKPEKIELFISVFVWYSYINQQNSVVN